VINEHQVARESSIALFGDYLMSMMDLPVQPVVEETLQRE
jgi:hypothetical protein